MKKISLITGICLIVFSASVYAQTKEASPTAEVVTPSVTETITDKEAKNLVNKLADKVAAMNKNKKGLSGQITEVSDNSLKIKDSENKEYTIKADPELTKTYSISSSNKKELKFNELKKDNYVIVSGINLDNTVNANFVYLDTRYLVKTGKVIEIDKTEYTLKVTTTDKDDYLLTVENFTKQGILNIKTLEIEKTGFSKLKEGDTIHFVANDLTLVRYLIIPQEYFIK